MSEKFRTKMNEYAHDDSKNMIFTEDLKNMIHLAESSPEDIGLVLQMMQRFVPLIKTVSLLLIARTNWHTVILSCLLILVILYNKFIYIPAS
jgi:hypothetical protein